MVPKITEKTMKAIILAFALAVASTAPSYAFFSSSDLCNWKRTALAVHPVCVDGAEGGAV